MSDFFTTSQYFQGIVSLAVMLVYLFDIFIFLQVIRLSAGRRLFITSLITLICSFVLFQALVTMDPVPVIHTGIVLGGLIIISFISFIEQTLISRIKRNRLTGLSVKEGFDRLPAGICFYNESGLPILTNHKMNQISLKVSGTSLSDAKSFWHRIQKGDLPESIQGAGDPMISFGDGSTFSFKCYPADLGNDRLYELVASDITEEYAKAMELKIKNERIRRINTRLKALNNTIRYMIMEKETLMLKVRLHDNLGQALILGRQYAHDPRKINRNELLKLWKNNLLLLKNEDREKWQIPYFVNIQRAKLLGVEIITEGELPQDDELISVIDTAIAVHTTNVTRHAYGEHAYIKTEKEENRYVIHFTNDGTPPEGAIREHGGLANLHDQVRMIGGTMNISSSPVFDMELILPRKTGIPSDPTSS